MQTVFGGIVLRVSIEAGLALTMASRMGENDEGSDHSEYPVINHLRAARRRRCPGSASPRSYQPR
jgi:hypothetical protein